MLNFCCNPLPTKGHSYKGPVLKAQVWEINVLIDDGIVLKHKSLVGAVVWLVGRNAWSRVRIPLATNAKEFPGCMSVYIWSHISYWINMSPGKFKQCHVSTYLHMDMTRTQKLTHRHDT